MQYIIDNLGGRVSDKDVVEAFQALALIEPSESYKVFTEAVKESTGEKWSCGSLKKMLGNKPQ